MLFQQIQKFSNLLVFVKQTYNTDKLILSLTISDEPLEF